MTQLVFAMFVLLMIKFDSSDLLIFDFFLFPLDQIIADNQRFVTDVRRIHDMFFSLYYYHSFNTHTHFQTKTQHEEEEHKKQEEEEKTNESNFTIQ